MAYLESAFRLLERLSESQQHHSKLREPLVGRNRFPLVFALENLNAVAVSEKTREKRTIANWQPQSTVEAITTQDVFDRSNHERCENEELQKRELKERMKIGR